MCHIYTVHEILLDKIKLNLEQNADKLNVMKNAFKHKK
jgi:hypothetical protein